MASKEKVLEETKLLVELFLKHNYSDKELSKITNISAATVGRRLTNEKNIKSLYKDDQELYKKIKMQRQENLKKGKVLGSQTTFLNHADNDKNNVSHVHLELLCSKKEENNLIIHLALTFRLHLDTLSSLLDIKESVLERRLLNACNSKTKKALENLFYFDKTKQENNVVKFLDYYKELLNAIIKKDNMTKSKLLNKVSDAYILEFKKNYIIGSKLKRKEVVVLLNYQIKYILTDEEIVKMFKIDLNDYRNKVENILQSNEDIMKLYMEIFKLGKSV